jgi:hypothetical protein
MGTTTTRVHKLLAYIPLGILLVLSVLACGIIIFFCRPVAKAWRQDIEGSCMDTAILDGFGKSVSGMKRNHDNIGDS